MIMQELGKVEDDIFRKRRVDDQNFKARMKAKRRREKLESDEAPAWLPRGQFAPQALGGGRGAVGAVTNAKEEAIAMRQQGMEANKNAAKSLKAMLKSGQQPEPSSSGNNRKRPAAQDSDDEEETPDEVRLYEDGFKDRYYESKFGVLPNEVEFRHRVAAEYTLGLCWVLRYYYQGCASWEWYFPYHYAPFASDFVNIGDIPTEFAKKTQPFKPLEQLMGVFPAASRSHVPAPWGELMTDPCAPIIDFYPEDFKIDLNGKKYAWQGVALLPFVDEVRLKAALVSMQHLLTPEEIKRNIRGDDRLYVREGHQGYNLLRTIYTDHFDENTEISLDGKMFEGMGGRVLHSKDCIPTDGTFESPVKGLKPVLAVRTLCVRYRDTAYPEDFIYPAKRLPGAVDPPNVLRPEDLLDRGANYTPRHGFGPRQDRAHLGQSGHRMLNHYHNSRNNQGAYAAIPPPHHGRGGFMMGSQNERSYDNGRGRHGRGGGYDNYRSEYGNRNSGRGHNYDRGYGHSNRGGQNYQNYSDRGGRGGYGNPYQGNQGNHHRGGGGGNRGGYSTRGHYGQQNQQRQNNGGGYYTSNYKRN